MITRLFGVLLIEFACTVNAYTQQLPIRDLLVKTAREAHACERELSRLEEVLIPMKARETQALEVLQNQKEQLSTTVRQLRHRHGYTPIIPILSSQSPSDYIHITIALKSLLPEIDRRDEKILNSMKTLTDIRQEMMATHAIFKETRVKLNQEAKTITLLQDQLQAIKHIQSEEDVPADTAVMIPAIGSWTNCFDSDKPEYESSRKGILIKTRSQALVIAPISGKITSAGSLSNRTGNGVIIQQGAQSFLVAGLGTLMCKADQQIRAGEPIGRMPAQISDGEGKRRPSLYVEVWQGGQLVNPDVVFNPEQAKKASS